MAKRKTIGENPLDAVVPRAPSRAPAAVAEARELPRPTKERMTFHLPVEVMERAKNAVFWTPGLTLADLAAQALTEAVDKLERKRGELFPPRKAELKGGRPMK
ncbi:MAG: hypothetical protein NTZ98_07830 [Acidobacteria bacterium]|jgi:hypothetical protein|nr:hypothetical protein [Acidobacteriota bacterium]